MNNKEISTIVGDSFDSFCDGVWLYVEPYLKREIVFGDDNHDVSWSEKEKPDYTDLEKFVSFYDGSVGRRTYDLTEINSTFLKLWSDERLITINIFPHSNSVLSKQNWKVASKNLVHSEETDRAGAVSETEINNLVERLKEVHRFHYVAPYITWRAWAEYIFKKGAHCRESLVIAPPPAHIIGLFQAARSNAENTNIQVRQNVSIAQGLNSGMGLDLESLVDEFQSAMHLHKETEQAFARFGAKLDAIKNRNENTSENLQLFASAFGPTESQSSRDYFDNIVTQEDIDHE